MSSYKFGQVTVSSKPFYEAIDIDIKTLNVDNILVSDPIIDNKKGKRYIIGYNIEGKIVALRIKTPKNVYSYGVVVGGSHFVRDFVVWNFGQIDSLLKYLRDDKISLKKV